MDRDWRDGDRVELSLDMPLRLTPLDAEHPNLVAVMRGPSALFALLPAPDTLTRAQLLSAQQTSPTLSNHLISLDNGEVHLWPYTSITDEHYRLYQQIS